MQMIIEELKKGNHSIVDYFVAAEKKWPEILCFIENLTTEELAEKISDRQSEFMLECGGDTLGKIIMAWSGFAHFYSCQEGFGDNANGRYAYKLAQAFQKSRCSVEVKDTAKQAANIYGTNDYA
ncbi:MAG: hypothetical protein FVQ81_05930 [Candidatus Glassbacteria bacterium]|nr:hypothetical protein [Candidatus Glassbacteria bacterium]